MSYYIGEFCLRGHVLGCTTAHGDLITIGEVDTFASHANAEGLTQVCTPFCPTCGAKVINRCPACKSLLRGGAEGVVGFDDHPDSYCYSCGAEMPWTQGRREAYEETIAELQASFREELPEHLADELRALAPDLLTETPKTELALLKIGRAAKGLGRVGAKVLYDVCIKVSADSISSRLPGQGE